MNKFKKYSTKSYFGPLYYTYIVFGYEIRLYNLIQSLFFNTTKIVLLNMIFIFSFNRGCIINTPIILYFI